MSQENLNTNEIDKYSEEGLFDIFVDNPKNEEKTLSEYLKQIQSNDDGSTDEKTDENKKKEGNEDFKESKQILEYKEKKEDINRKTIKLEDSSIPEQSTYNKETQDNILINDNKKSLNNNEPKKGTTNNLIIINIKNQKQKSLLNQGPSNNGPNLINNKQNLPNPNKDHNNPKSYIVYVFENKINFPEKELFFGALRKKENIEDFFPKDIIYILIGEKELQNGDHKYYYENILINEIYSILKRKDEKIFILIDIEK